MDRDDLFVFNSPDNSHRNTFGLVAHGDVMDSAGNTRRLNFQYRANWDGNDLNTFRDRTKVQLK